MLKKILFSSVLMLAIIITGCFSDKKKEVIPPKTEVVVATQEFAITLNDLTYVATGSGVTVTVNIPSSSNVTAGTIYYVVNTTFPAIAPTAAEIRTGRDARWNPYYRSGSITTAGLVAEQIVIADLGEATEYDIFIGASDLDGDIIRTVTKLHITADTTPPEISTISAIEIKETTAKIAVTQSALNLNGKLFYLVTTTGAVTPTSGQIIVGQDGSSTTAGVIKSGNAIIKTTAQAIAIIGLVRYTDYKVYVVAQDVNKNLQITPSSISIRTSDITAPVFTSAPAITATSTSAVITAKLGEDGTVYYAVYPAGTATSGTTPGMIKAGSTSTTTGSVTTSKGAIATITITAASISFDKQYEVFVVAEDMSGNMSAVVTKLHIGSDFSAPAIEDTTISAISATETTAVVNIGLGEAGKVYYVVLPNASATPSAAQVVAKQTSTGAAVTTAGIFTLTGASAQNFTIMGLKAYTDYEVFIVGEDKVIPTANRQTTVSSIHIKTIDSTAPKFTTTTSIIATSTSAVATVTLSEEGTIYYAIFPNATTTKTPSEVIAGTGSVTSGAVTTAGITSLQITLAAISFDTEYELFLVAKDISNVTQAAVTKVHLQTDKTAPATLTLTTETAISPETTAKINVGLGEKGKVYYVVTTTGAVTPTAGAIKAKTGYTTGGTITLSSTANLSYVVTGLSRLNDYKLFAVGEDSRANLQTTVSSILISTKDITKPVNTTGYPAKVTVTTNTAVIEVSVNESATVYYTVVAKSTTIYTAAQIKAATTATSICGSTTVAAATAKTITISGLTANTDYDIWTVAADTSGNIQNAGTKITIDTAGNISTLKATSTVKGTVATLGTPNTSMGAIVAGAVTITSSQAVNISNTGLYITLFDPTDSSAAVKVVKYATGAAITGFATDTAYANQAIADQDFFIIRVTAQDGTTINYYKVVVTRTSTLGSVSTLKSTSTIKGVVPTLGDLVVPGTVTLTYHQANDTSNAGDFITLFDKTDQYATARVVKYTSQAAITGFDTDAVYANQAIADQDFFLVKVTAENGSASQYYKVIVTVNAPSAVATLAASTVKGITITAGTPVTSTAITISAPGSVHINSTQAANTSNAGAYITLFDKTFTYSAVKVVKYATGAAITGFATDTAYANQAITDQDFFIVRVTAEDSTTVNYYKVIVTIDLSADATLSNVTVKGVTASGLGTPGTTASSIVAGAVAITSTQAITGAGIVATVTESHATISKIVKYATAASVAAFASDTAYDNSAAVTDQDFFIIEVTAEDGTKKYYKIVATVS